jgi:protein-L-isoaspartate(D-aspartate) O-methyltransferase
MWMTPSCRSPDQPAAALDGAPGSGDTDETVRARAGMVREQIEGRGVHDARVLAALRRVPRHLFIPEAGREEAYEDHPVRIGEGQTISQPFIVAAMTELLELGRGDRVLEIGTGSGYQAAVLAEIVGADNVYSVEILAPIARLAAANLARLGYAVHLRVGDGYQGWPEAAPFDAVVVTAATPRVPGPLRAQLAVGGRMVLPVGEPGRAQVLLLVRRTPEGFSEKEIFGVIFVPMTGEAQR